MKGRVNIFPFLLKACLPCLLLLCGPAFFFSCSKEEPPSVNTETRIYIDESILSKTENGKPAIKSLDIFVFDNDGDKSIDSYERFESFEKEGWCCVSSKSGEKKLVAVANCPSELLRFSEFNCYEDLRRFSFELENDRTDSPFMSGETEFTAGTDKGCSVKLKPLISEMIVSGITSERDVEKVKVGLRNISTRAEILQMEDFQPTGIELQGEMTNYRAGMSVYCYPNSGNGGLGSPQTELVISWEENGEEKEYAEIINPGTGIERGARYYFRIVI